MSRRSRPVLLAIDGLPAELRALRIGGLYAVLADQRSAQIAMVLPTIADALQSRQSALLVSSCPNAQILEPIGASGLDVLQLLRSGVLRLMRLLPDGARKLRSLGMPQVLDEFDHFGTVPGGLICVVPGDSVFVGSLDGGHPARDARLLREWLRGAGCAMLLVLETPDQELLTDGGFDGIARLRVFDGDVLHWMTDFWRLPGGDSISSTFELRLNSAGRLVVDTRQPTGDRRYDATSPEAADRDRVITMVGVVRGERRVPPHWEQVDGHEALQLRASSAHSAACILDISGPQHFLPLARTVHALRRARGPSLKIVVYEIGTRLRRAQEQFLLAMGANAVVVGSGLDRLQAVLDAIRDQRFVRSLPADFDLAFHAALPQYPGGYLAPASFCTETLEACRRARVLQVDSMLVRLRPRPDTDPFTALAAFDLDRQGDAITWADSHVWLYLFACRAAEAEAVLTRLCGRPVGDLFEAIDWQAGNEAASRALLDVQRWTDAHVSEDYTAKLADHRATSVPSAPTLPISAGGGRSVAATTLTLHPDSPP